MTARTPKAIAVSKLIGGKLVTTLAKSELEKLEATHSRILQLMAVNEWREHAIAASEAVERLIDKVKGG